MLLHAQPPLLVHHLLYASSAWLALILDKVCCEKETGLIRKS